MTKTDKALRIELEDLKNTVFQLNKDIRREHVRVDRVVQVLLNNLTDEQLRSKVRFSGTDCHGNYRYWGSGMGYTLKEFLLKIIDP